MTPPDQPKLAKSEEQSDESLLWPASLLVLIFLFVGVILMRGLHTYKKGVTASAVMAGSLTQSQGIEEVEQPLPGASPLEPHPELSKRHGRTVRDEFAQSAEKRLNRVSERLKDLERHVQGSRELSLEVTEMNKQVQNVAADLRGFEASECPITQDEVDLCLNDLETRLDNMSGQFSLAR